MAEVRPNYKKPRSILVLGSRRRYAYRDGKMIEITNEPRQEVPAFHIGNAWGAGWNGR